MLRDVPSKEQLALKEDYERLSQDTGTKKNFESWQKSFNGKLFEKIFLETIKELTAIKFILRVRRVEGL